MFFAEKEYVGRDIVSAPGEMNVLVGRWGHAGAIWRVWLELVDTCRMTYPQPPRSTRSAGGLLCRCNGTSMRGASAGGQVQITIGWRSDR